MRSGRHGLTLLEVLVALVLIGLGATSLTALLGQGMQSARIARSRYDQVQRASVQLGRISVWTSGDFAAHIGRRRMHGYWITVSEIRPALFAVAIADTISAATILQTSFYAADSSAQR